MDEQVQSKVKVPDRLKTTTCWLFSHLDAENPTNAAAQSVTLTASETVATTEEPAEAPQEASLAQLQEDYDVLGIVGESPVCRVYKVRNKRMGIVMALKVLKDEFATSTAAEKQFQREVNAATTLCHPNIVPIYGHGRLDNNAAFVVEKLCDGAKNLAQVIKQDGALEPERALNLFRQVADAMEHAHTKAVTHGDLKPSNIVVTGLASAQTLPDKPGDVQKGEASYSHSNQQPKHTWVRVARLLACAVLFIMVPMLTCNHQVTVKPWDTAFHDYQDSADKIDGAKTIEIAEHMLTLADDRHMPVTMALAAEAYWRTGNDAKAHELLARDIDLCKKNKRYLSAISACETQFGEQLRSGDLAAAHDSAQQALSLVNACTDPSNWRETPVRVDEDSWTPLMSNRWLYPVLRNLGAEDLSSDNPEPAIDAFDFKWTSAPPEKPMADFCQMFLRYGDAKDAQYFAEQMMQDARARKLSDREYGMYAAYLAIASEKLGDSIKADEMEKVALQKLNVAAVSTHDTDRLEWPLAQLAAQSLIENDTPSAKYFMTNTPGMLIWADRSKTKLAPISTWANKAINSPDDSDPCEGLARAMGQHGDVAQINAMYQNLLTGMVDSGTDESSWVTRWSPLSANYIEDLTMLKHSADAHDARQEALDQIGQVIGDPVEEPSLSNMSDALLRIFGSSLVEKDLKQAQLTLALMGKINSPKDSPNYDQWRLMRAELPAYSGNVKESFKRLSSMLVERKAANSGEFADSDSPLYKDQIEVDVEVHAALAKLNLLSDQPKLAIAQYQKAIQLSPNGNHNPDEQAYLRVDLARAYMQDGQTSKAREQIELISPFRRRLSYPADAYYVSAVAKLFPDLLKKTPGYIFPQNSDIDPSMSLPDWRAFRLL